MQAVEFAKESVKFGDLSGDDFRRVADRTTLADALHQCGRLEESAASFREAEAMQAEWQPEYPRLYSVQGYQYCDFLLSRAERRTGLGARAAVFQDALDLLPDADECRDVLGRARQTLGWAEGQSLVAPLVIALDHLSLGRAHLGLAQATVGSASPDADAAAKHLDQAVDVLRQAGIDEYIGRGLLARAVLRRFRADLDGASADLDEAAEIAERGHMRLHECDVHLEGTRQCLVRGDVRGAGERLEKARAIVEETGYRRREREVELLTTRLSEAQGRAEDL